MNYAHFYHKLENYFKNYQKWIILANKTLTALMYCIYPLILLTTFIFERNDFLKVLIIPAISFLIVTEMRKAINRKRPYERWSITPIIPKDTKGHSFPSRHVFSATIIAITALYLYLPLGVLLLIISLLIGILRVIGGVHYPSDVIFALIQAMIAGLFFWII